MAETIGRMAAIKQFFQADGPGDLHGRQVTMQEMQALTPKDKDDLAGPCAAALGKTLEVSGR